MRLIDYVITAVSTSALALIGAINPVDRIRSEVREVSSHLSAEEQLQQLQTVYGCVGIAENTFESARQTAVEDLQNCLGREINGKRISFNRIPNTSITYVVLLGNR